MLKHVFSAFAITLAVAASASANNMRFEAWGTVSQASGATGAYSGIAPGQNAHLVFVVSTPGTDVNPGHVTNFTIVPGSLTLAMGPVTVSDSGGTPGATMRNADPLADGVLASATLTSSKNLGFSFSDCSGTMFNSTVPEQNLGTWTGQFYCVYGWTVTGSGTYIEIDLSSFAISYAGTGQPLCYGDGTQAVPCPCANSGLPGRGCQNSAGTGGALLLASGSTTPDMLQFTSSGELPHSLSILLQGTTGLSSPLPFGDGLRCVGGALRRLYSRNANDGTVIVPVAGDLSVSARSAALGDPILPGSSRWYQVYYRDANTGFCPAPGGNTWNVSNGIRIDW